MTTHFGLSSSIPTPDAKHLPDTLQTDHPAAQPTASTYPSELHSSARTGPGGCAGGGGGCNSWCGCECAFLLCGTSDSSTVPLLSPTAMIENFALIAAHVARDEGVDWVGGGEATAGKGLPFNAGVAGRGLVAVAL